MTAGHGSKRPQREDAAVGALLSEPTIAEAATKAGVSESTLLRWLADPAFKARYREGRHQVVEQAVSALQRAAMKAVDALERNLACGAPPSEIAAARAVLDQAFRGLELSDLAERIEQLEQSGNGGAA